MSPAKKPAPGYVLPTPAETLAHYRAARAADDAAWDAWMLARLSGPEVAVEKAKAAAEKTRPALRAAARLQRHACSPRGVMPPG